MKMVVLDTPGVWEGGIMDAAALRCANRKASSPLHRGGIH